MAGRFSTTDGRGAPAKDLAERTGTLCLAACLAGFAAPVGALEEVVAACSEWPPYVIGGEQPQGLLVEHATRVLNELGFAPRIVVYPWKRVILGARRGNIDFVFCAEEGQAQAYGLDYLAPLLESPTMVIHRAGTTLEGLEWDDIRVAVGAGYWYGEAFERRRHHHNVAEVADDLGILKMVALGRSEAGLIEQRVLEDLMATHADLARLVTVRPTPYSVQRFFLAASRTSTLDVEALRERLQAIGDDLMLR